MWLKRKKSKQTMHRKSFGTAATTSMTGLFERMRIGAMVLAFLAFHWQCWLLAFAVYIRLQTSHRNPRG